MNTYDNIAHCYDSLFSDKESKEQNIKVIKDIKPFINGQILDIGCGTGLLIDYLNIPVENYTGIDVSIKMLEVFRKKHPEYKRRLFNIRYENFIKNNGKKFDLIIALFGTMNYIGPYNSIYKLLKLNGKYYLMYFAPNYYPETYIRSGVEMKHKNLKVKGVNWNNYIIVTNIKLI